MNHLDINSPSYGQKKGRESNWQFDSRPLNFFPMFAEGVRLGIGKLEESYNFGLDLIPIGGRSREI